MDVIDDEGFVFGVVNIVDALVVLMVLAVVVAGASLVMGAGDDQTTTQPITFETGPQPGYVIDAVSEGSVPTSDVVAVENKTVRTNADNQTYLVLEVRLVISTTSDGLSRYDGERLHVGRTLTLDLGETILDGVVVEMGERRIND